MPWLVQNHSTICLDADKYRPKFFACQRVRLKISEKSFHPFLPLPEGTGGRKPLSLLAFLGFCTPRTGSFRFFHPAAPPASWRASPAPSRAPAAARRREERMGRGCCHGHDLSSFQHLEKNVKRAERNCSLEFWTDSTHGLTSIPAPPKVNDLLGPLLTSSGGWVSFWPWRDRTDLMTFWDVSPAVVTDTSFVLE